MTCEHEWQETDAPLITHTKNVQVEKQCQICKKKVIVEV